MKTKLILLALLFVAYTNTIHCQTTFYYSAKRKIYLQPDSSQMFVRLKGNALGDNLRTQLNTLFPTQQVQDFTGYKIKKPTGKFTVEQ